MAICSHLHLRGTIISAVMMKVKAEVGATEVAVSRIVGATEVVVSRVVGATEVAVSRVVGATEVAVSRVVGATEVAVSRVVGAIEVAVQGMIELSKWRRSFLDPAVVTTEIFDKMSIIFDSISATVMGTAEVRAPGQGQGYLGLDIG